MAIDGKKLHTRDDANIAFDRANFEKSHDGRDAARDTPPYPEPPQPALTPDGTLREVVDKRVREKREAIKAKLKRDRQSERER